MNTGGQLNIGYNNGGTAGSSSRKNYITTAAQITSTGTWYHLVAIYKGIAVTPGLYVNGVEITAFNSPTGSATTLAYSSSAKGSIGVGRNGIQTMEGKISNCACFDRTLTQAENLDILLKIYQQKIDIVLKLNVGLETIKKRISERKSIEKRADDNEEIAIKRFQTYEKSSEPVLDYYRQN